MDNKNIRHKASLKARSLAFAIFLTGVLALAIPFHIWVLTAEEPTWVMAIVSLFPFSMYIRRDGEPLWKHICNWLMTKTHQVIDK